MDLHAKELREQFWKTDALNGSPIGTPYKEIEFLSESSKNDGERVRRDKLHHILEYAINNCPFYSSGGKYNSDDLNSFPVMNKLKYIENYDGIKVDESVIPGQIGPVHIQSTSGSTGTPFKVPQDTRKRQRRIAELKYFGKIVGFDSHEMLIHLRTWNRWQTKTAAQIKSENIIPFDISDMGDDKLAELCKIINDNKALCLRGYASSFGLLANYVKEHPMSFQSLKNLSVCASADNAIEAISISVIVSFFMAFGF